MTEWPEGSRRVITAAFAVLVVCLGVVALLVWTVRRPAADLARAARESAPPAGLALPFQHGPKERRQLRDLSVLAADAGAGSTALPGTVRAKDELVEVQPGEGPVAVSGPGGVTWSDRYPSARIVYVTTGADEPGSSPPDDTSPTPPPAERSEEPSRPRSSQPRTGADDPNAAFDPPGQYR